MIDAVIFDMDGLLIDSEPLWETAEMEAFPALGVPLTPELKKCTTGLRSAEIVQYWNDRYPWPAPSPPVVASSLIARLVSLVHERGELKPGAKMVLELCAVAGQPMAIASSSPSVLIEAVLDTLAIRHHFKVVYSAESEEYGKPHPGVYVSTAKKLATRCETCLALEDSPNGVLAAKSAQMACVAVPNPALRFNRTIQIADRVIDSLEDFEASFFTQLGPILAYHRESSSYRSSNNVFG